MVEALRFVMNGLSNTKRDYEDVKRKLLKFKSTIASVEPLLKKIEQLNATFKNLESLAHNARVINQRVALRLTGVVRSMLGSDYNLGRKTGKLYAAAVAGAVMGSDAKGIKIQFARGQGGRVYKYGAAQNYGYVVGGKGLGRKAKASIKKAAFSNKALSARAKAGYTKRGVNLGSLKVIAPKGFFALKDSQVAVLQEKYVEIWQQEVDKAIKRAKSGRRS
jgi:hypothetical protein